MITGCESEVPLFVTCNVHVRAPPATAVPGDVFVIARSASVPKGESSESVLFVRLSSGVVDETLALLTIRPCTSDATFTVTSTVAKPPTAGRSLAASAGSVQAKLRRSGAGVQIHPPGAAGVTDVADT